ncbi:MAG TPA: ester cyclase [Thermomicrobiales bacterium]|nr:ester cyclase [Thermomicrobiales bacterium]
MTTDLKALIRRYWGEPFNTGNLAVVDEVVAADYVWHGGGREVRGPEGCKSLFAPFLTGFAERQWTADGQIAEGDQVATRWTFTGTHVGPFRGIPPTGRRVTTTGIVVSRVVGGRVVEEWEWMDGAGLLRQLETATTPPTAAE